MKQLKQLKNDHMHMIIHDLKSPLTGIIGMVDLLESSIKENPISETQKKYLFNTKHSAKILKEMVDLALDLLIMEEGEHDLIYEELDLLEVIKDASELVSGMNLNKKLNVIENGSVKCICDRMIMVRVVTNLLSNAIKYTPSGGTITISVKYYSHYAIVKVKDTGAGIPKEYQQEIFKKFGQANSKQYVKINSTGLGLTFCKWAIEAHNGNIGVESNNGDGSTFWFQIPVNRNHEEEYLF